MASNSPIPYNRTNVIGVVRSASQAETEVRAVPRADLVLRSPEHKRMAGNLTFDQLKKAVADGEIDTVVVCLPDMQGTLVGKRFQAEYFLDGAYEETHGCDYLLANDIDMEPVPGYAVANWEKGYGDFVMKPDLATLRRVPVAAGDRAGALRRARPSSSRAAAAYARARCCASRSPGSRAMNMSSYFASELEFYLFDETYESAEAKAWRDLKTTGSYIEDYHIFQTTKEEGVMRAIRKGLQGAGIPVENSKGEWGPGQEEINVRYADALTMADWHVILKNGCKEIAHSLGQAVTFMAKWRYDLAGSSSHIHASLWDAAGKTPLFFDRQGRVRHVGVDAPLRGRAARLCARDHLVPRALHQFLQALPGRHLRADQGDLEPDNRTAGFRLCGEGSKGDPHRMPHRRRRSQSLSRLRRADRRRACRHRGEAGARSALCRRRLSRQGAARGAEDAARGDGADAEVENAARRLRRRGHRSLCAHRRVGAVRI